MNALNKIAIPTIPGTPFEGGFYVARYFVEREEFVLIDAGAAGELRGSWGEYGQDVATTTSDGLANTRAMAEAGSELARKALAMELNGFGDWYLPSRQEQALQYFSLLDADGYQAEQTNTFAPRWYWSSTQYSPHYAWVQHFAGGYQNSGHKGSGYRARAVRRFKVTP
ncbi:DUF1566 domain-containing protein [Pseudomonas sp. LFM046]|uniref:Lcl C-terminal domain-containing protein n=1 Tax=Pseudomonas sp. LFM046 TaxID=1608357 RepID=UPI0005CFA4AA|nr:DUF1566 domain-containing protein [Pseudomonas sp. LFM046]